MRNVAITERKRDVPDAGDGWSRLAAGGSRSKWRLAC